MKDRTDYIFKEQETIKYNTRGELSVEDGVAF